MARSISTSPERDASQSKVTPLQFVRFDQQFASTHLHYWVERGCVGVKSLAQEPYTMSPDSAQTRTAHSEDKRINHDTTVPPTSFLCYSIF